MTMKGRGPRPQIDPAAEFRARLVEHFRWLGDRPDGPRFADIAGWWRDPRILGALGQAVADLALDERPDVILGPESQGMLLGALVATHLGLGLIGLRKEPRPAADSDTWITATTPPDYRDRTLAMGVKAHVLAPGTRVLFVDDWVDTGGQLLAAHTVVARAKATWCGAAVIVDALADPRLRRDLRVRSLLNVRDL